ncbi:MAG: hypothetical protein OHK93_001603 [Ramalina farinacea]|uniref:Uncharacterized protein n=1 Tax=Ramalina farinacea TaxID=258253 RepID=A0AA43QU82_9LECA|nr:hypothetical protein [Ramalina farinacea]
MALATPVYTKQSDRTPDSASRHPTKVSPNDKPLPAPPIAQVVTNSPRKPRITLIDATEKPLRRSPTGTPEAQEEWPTLEPQRAVSRSSVQDVMRETGAQLLEQVSTGGERYPRLGDTTEKSFEDQLPMSTYSPASGKGPRKGISAPDLKAQTITIRRLTDPFDSTEPGKTEFVADKKDTTAGAAALEKSTSQDFTEVRQTRTSSLRARLSAGEVVRDNNSKTIGFTDFTAPAESTAGPSRRDSLRARNTAQASNVPSSRGPNAKTSLESIGNRLPATFVAGSRRPHAPRRPGSRGSLRDEGTGLVSSRPASSTSSHEQTSSTDATVKQHQKGPGRRSSIPVARPIVITVGGRPGSSHSRDNQATSSHSVGNGKTRTLNKTPTAEYDPFCYQKQPNASIAVKAAENLETAADGSQASVQETESQKASPYGHQTSTDTTAANKEMTTLEAIDESPRHTYTFRRLSTKAPSFGPTLSISPSADKYIMGTGENKENRPPSREKPAGHSAGHGRASSATRNRLDRPLSNIESSPRTSLVDSRIREKKTKSVEYSSTGSATVDVIAPNRSSKQPSVSTDASADPFYDASEDPHADVQAGAQAGKIPVEEDDAWISPLAKKLNAASDGIESDATKKEGQGVSKSTIKEANDGKAQKLAQDLVKLERNSNKNYSKPTATSQAKRSGDDPFTPETHHGHPASSDSHPLRGSSKQKPLTAVQNKTVSAIASTKEVGPPTPPKEYLRRQNALGSANGYGSSQLDLQAPGSGYVTAKRAPVNRDSVAHNSVKSQSTLTTSLSMTRFNFKNLFHKKGTDTASTSAKKGKKTSTTESKSRAHINGNGSPFPAISDIHPIHRPSASPPKTSSSASTYRAPPVPARNPSHRLTATSAGRPQTPLLSTSESTADISRSTHLAMSLLDSARKETSSPKKEKLLELGKIMVDCITRARDAELAFEEAKLAAARAEKASEACRQAVREVGGMVEGLRRQRG